MSNKERILLVEDDDDMRASCREVLEMAGHVVLEASSAKEAGPILNNETVDLIVTDLRMPDGGGEEVLREVKALCPGTPVLVVTAYPAAESAIEAFRGGVADYLLKPFTATQLIEAINRALAARYADDRAELLRHLGAGAPDLPQMIGASSAFQQLIADIRRVAPLDGAVQIQGEAGSGRQLVARAIHALSHRAGKPFAVVKCAGVAENLIEAELFGCEKGAFAGATSTKPGPFETASGGLLFIDDVAELSLTTQGKVLRCLDERAVRRVGALRTRPAAVRIITGTHKDLGKLVAEGKFRQDLLHRLAVLEVRVPSLRERREDIPTLAVHFLDRMRAETKRDVLGFDEEAFHKLVSHQWPGNVRELQNVIQKAFASCAPPVITATDLVLRAGAGAAADAHPPISVLEALEHRHVSAALQAQKGDMTHTAKVLGVRRTTLQRLIERLGIVVDEPG